MLFPKLSQDRFIPQTGLHITVQVPHAHAAQLRSAIAAADPLLYGDYDTVSFETMPGTQRFRALGSGRNPATKDVVSVDCLELSVFVENNETTADRVLKAIYQNHPYEEPVVYITPCLRTLHIRGLDEDNPNRFWNAAPQDWVPPAHR